jgi:hypothetical protein
MEIQVSRRRTRPRRCGRLFSRTDGECGVVFLQLSSHNSEFLRLTDLRCGLNSFRLVDDGHRGAFSPHL